MTSVADSVKPTKDHIEGIRLGLALLGWLLASIVLGFTTYGVLPTLLPHWASDISRLSAVIVAEVYFLLIVAMTVAMGGLDGTRDRLHVRPVESGELSFTIAIWAVAYVVAFAVYVLLSTVFPAFPSASELARFLVIIGTDMGRLDGADVATWNFVIIRACVFAPIAEELLFRGALFGWLRGHLSAWPTIGITAAGFAAIHGISGTMVPLALIVGLAAGYVRERTGSVTPLIIVHILQNVVIVSVGVWSIRYIA